MSNAAGIPLVLFAKAPVAGAVKTRLQPQCTAEQCADIASILLTETVRKACKYWPGNVVLAVWPDLQNPFLRHLADEYGLIMHQQVDGDLGEKMHASLLHFGYPAAVIGCDTPQISAADLQLAHQNLAEGLEVIGPSNDGGYYFLGLNNPAPDLFAQMPWGGNCVLSTTLDRALATGRTLQLLSCLNDIDTWQDLITSELPALQAYTKTIKPE